jgi:putative ABC transport system substrate-binding protein
MKRRALLAAVPVFASASRGLAQTTARTARVGVITGLGEQDRESIARIAALRQGLAEKGWREGVNLTIDVRYSPDTAEKARTLAAELLAFKPDVAVIQAPAMAAMLEAKSAVPIVFLLGADPVGAKWVESLARPGGNVTGLTGPESDVGAKWVEFLTEVAPAVRHIVVIRGLGSSVSFGPAIDRAAAQRGIDTTYFTVGSPAEIESAIAAAAAKPNSGLVLPTDAFTTAQRHLVVDLAMRHRLPLSAGSEPVAAAGGLVVYTVNTVDIYRRAAVYVDRILKGERPADLPVQRPTLYTLSLNLRTAAALGLTVSPILLARADEIIE